MGGSRGGGWIGWLATLLQNSSPKNIPKYNTWKNIPKYMAPKEIEKTTGDNIFPCCNLLRKRGHIMSPQVITSKSQETTVELRRGSTTVCNFLRKSVINRYILNGKKFEVEHLLMFCLNDSETQE